MKTSFRVVALMSAIALACLIGVQPSTVSAAWPERPIEWVCATGPSSGAAAWCRSMAELTSKELGQHVEVIFEGGGGGNTAAEYVLSKPADGYTWLHRNTSYAGYMNMPTFRPDPTELEVVVEVEKFLYVIGVRSDSKYKKFMDIIEDMKARPGEVSVAGNKPGSAHHRHLINLFNAFDVEWNFIPYKGSGGAMKDVLGGHVETGIIPYGIWAPHVESGDARSLLLLNEEHYDRIPPLPIPKDLGADYKFTHQVQGIFLKVNTPDEAKRKIQDAFKKAVETATYQKYVETNAHVVPQFNIDDEQMTKDFHEMRVETGTFLKEAGLIK